mmetsp:Transcript_3600/g.7894  ORF Transcript_3600/g.7894 Transcript_3600/m.7894 type:complete len:515 (-) Transcript_3600:132-1676(-)
MFMNTHTQAPMAKEDSISAPPGLSNPRKMSKQQSKSENSVDLKQADIVAAVESLYADRVKPWGRILRKRLAEMHTEYEALPHHTKNLEKMCRKNKQLKVCMDGAGDAADWSVEMVNRSTEFVDAQSRVDIYPESMWAAADAFFGAPEQQSLELPRCRYDCAQALAGMNLPFLEGRVLGELCHIVQLCISQKKMLGQRRGMLVPYELSQSKVKEERAAEGLAAVEGSESEQTATWTDVVRGVQSLLATHGCVPLPSLKQLFNESQAVKLHETVLGYSKIRELVQDPRLAAICELKLDKKGYFLTAAGDERPRAVHVRMAKQQSRRQSFTASSPTSASSPSTSPSSSRSGSKASTCILSSSPCSSRSGSKESSCGTSSTNSSMFLSTQPSSPTASDPVMSPLHSMQADFFPAPSTPLLATSAPSANPWAVQQSQQRVAAAAAAVAAAAAAVAAQQLPCLLASQPARLPLPCLLASQPDHKALALARTVRPPPGLGNPEGPMSLVPFPPYGLLSTSM